MKRASILPLLALASLSTPANADTPRVIPEGAVLGVQSSDHGRLDGPTLARIIRAKCGSATALSILVSVGNGPSGEKAPKTEQFAKNSIRGWLRREVAGAHTVLRHVGPFMEPLDRSAPPADTPRDIVLHTLAYDVRGQMHSFMFAACLPDPFPGLPFPVEPGRIMGGLQIPLEAGGGAAEILFDGAALRKEVAKHCAPAAAALAIGGSVPDPKNTSAPDAASGKKSARAAAEKAMAKPPYYILDDQVGRAPASLQPVGQAFIVHEGTDRSGRIPIAIAARCVQRGK